MLDGRSRDRAGRRDGREAPVMVGGDPELFARCPADPGRAHERVRHMGPNGSRRAAKPSTSFSGPDRLALAGASCSGCGRASTGTPCSRSSRRLRPLAGDGNIRGERMVEGNVEAEGKLAQH